MKNCPKCRSKKLTLLAGGFICQACGYKYLKESIAKWLEFREIKNDQEDRRIE
jgi:ribosomal protein L37AE/L43A